MATALRVLRNSSAALVACIAGVALVLAAGAASSAAAGTPPIAPYPATLHFADTTLGHPVSATVTLTNQSKRTRRVHFRPEPADSPFTVAPSSCPDELGPHASCRVTVTFTPTHLGQTTDTLVYLLDNSPLQGYAVHLVGTAHEPA